MFDQTFAATPAVTDLRAFLNYLTEHELPGDDVSRPAHWNHPVLGEIDSFICTSSARAVALRFGGRVFGYHVDSEDPIIGSVEGGHDFAVVMTTDGLYIVDWWAGALWSEPALVRLNDGETPKGYYPRERWDINQAGLKPTRAEVDHYMDILRAREYHDEAMGYWGWKLDEGWIQSGMSHNGARLIARKFGGKAYYYQIPESNDTKHLIGHVKFFHNFAVVDTIDEGKLIVDFWAKACGEHQPGRYCTSQAWVNSGAKTRYLPQVHWQEDTDNRYQTTSFEFVDILPSGNRDPKWDAHHAAVTPV